MATRRGVLAALAGVALSGAARPAAAAVPYQATFEAAAAHYGIDAGWLIAVARCESGFDPNAVGKHGEIGIMQFMPLTFADHGGTDIWDPVEQIWVAARMFSQGLACAHWVCARCGLEEMG